MGKRTPIMCKAPRCKRFARGLKEYCRTHERRLINHGFLEFPTPYERIMKHTKRSKAGCLELTKYVSKVTGYGLISDRRNGVGHKHAHRIVYKHTHRVIPNGLFVCHSCDNKKCVEIKHLFVGTPMDNTTDALSKGRMSHGEKHSIALASRILTPEQVKAIRQSNKTPTVLAKEYGVALSTISSIRHRKTWKWLV